MSTRPLGSDLRGVSSHIFSRNPLGSTISRTSKVGLGTFREPSGFSFQATRSRFGGVEAGTRGTETGETFELRPDPDTDSNVYTLRPAPNKVNLGTSTRASFREKAVSEKNQETMTTDFSTIKNMLMQIPEYQDMQYLNIDLDHGIFTMHMHDGTIVSKGRPEIKQALREALAADPDNGPEFIEGEIKKIDSAMLSFRSICGREGLSNIWPHTIRGQDTRGNFIGGKSLQANHPILQAKQCDSLKHGKAQLNSLLDQIKGKDPAETAKKRHEAAKRALRSEAFLIKMRKNLSAEIQRIDLKIPTKSGKDKKKLESKKSAFIRLQDQIRSNTQRYALYCAAVFDIPGTDKKVRPEECYKAICRNMYNSAYEEMTKGKPSFEEFMASPDSEPLRQYAADAASTLIADFTEYQLFCKDHDIPPKQDHINVFLMQAMQGEEINYNAVTIGFKAAERESLQEIIKDTNKRVDSELDARVRTVDPGRTLSPEKRLEAVLENNGWEPLFADSEVDHSMWTNPQTGWQKAVAYPLRPLTAAGQGIKAVWHKIRGS